MPKLTLGERKIEIDEDGFMQKLKEWDKAVAEDLANVEGAPPMNDDAWKLVNYIREYYLHNEIAPPIRVLVKQTGLSLKYIYQLFPKGPAKGACKVAGLPRPTGCV